MKSTGRRPVTSARSPPRSTAPGRVRRTRATAAAPTTQRSASPEEPPHRCHRQSRPTTAGCEHPRRDSAEFRCTAPLDGRNQNMIMTIDIIRVTTREPAPRIEPMNLLRSCRALARPGTPRWRSRGCGEAAPPFFATSGWVDRVHFEPVVKSPHRHRGRGRSSRVPATFLVVEYALLAAQCEGSPPPPSGPAPRSRLGDGWPSANSTRSCFIGECLAPFAHGNERGAQGVRPGGRTVREGASFVARSSVAHSSVAHSCIARSFVAHSFAATSPLLSTEVAGLLAWC